MFRVQRTNKEVNKSERGSQRKGRVTKSSFYELTWVGAGRPTILTYLLTYAVAIKNEVDLLVSSEPNVHITKSHNRVIGWI